MAKKSKKIGKSLTLSVFYGTFITGILVYLLSAIIFVLNVYRNTESQVFRDLEIECNFLESFMPLTEQDYLRLSSAMNSPNRITLINPDGSVYFDNLFEREILENHSDRQEFLEAIKNGTAKSIRYSTTLSDRTLYFAKKVANGDVIRISCNQKSVLNMFLETTQLFLIVLVLAIVVSIISARIISKRAVSPFDKIDLDNPDVSDVYEELKPFVKRIAEENYEKQQREQVRQQYTANVSHELKTPLTSISGFAEILKDIKTDKATTREFASTIYEESQRMIALVNDIIKLSKLDEESITQEKEDFNLRDIAKEIIKIQTPVAAKRNISLKLIGDSGSMNGVFSVIYEMLYNLIDNAVKYNKENGSVLVEIKNLSEKKQISFSVTDTGIGIPKNERERIFERFYRVDKSRSKESGGTGLGLSIVKHAAKFHDAQISISSEVGKGSKFTVIFNSL